MNGYTKLFCSIITSTIWREPKETKILWITMLALADKYGEVAGSVPGLATMAGLSIEETQVALKALESPDVFSRTQEEEGRRVRPVEGGWFLINHAKYREMMNADDRKEYLRKKQAEYRERVSKRNKPAVAIPVTDVSDTSTPSTHAESSVQSAEAVPESIPPEMTIYAEYPRKVGRADALKAIRAALKTKMMEFLLERTKAYAEATAAWPESEKHFIPHPATWFNRGSYDDDPETWKRQETKEAGPRASWA